MFLNHCQGCRDSVPAGSAQLQCTPARRLANTVSPHRKHQNTTRTCLISFDGLRTIQDCLLLVTLASTDGRDDIVNGTDSFGNDSAMMWHRRHSNWICSYKVSHWLTHLGLLQDIPSDSTLPHVRAVCQTSANAIDIRTESLPLTPQHCPVSLACLLTDTRAQPAVWTVHRDTKKNLQPYHN